MSEDKLNDKLPDGIETDLLARALTDCGVGAWKVDLVEETIFVDAADAALLGLEPRAQTLTTEAFSKLIHPDDRDRVTAEYLEAREAGKNYEIECRFVHPDGEVCWLIGRGIFLADDGNDGMAGIHIDVTDQHRVQDALRESRRRLITLMSNLPGMAYRCRNDPRWTMLFVSEGAEELCGYSARELLSETVHWDELILEEDRQWLWKHVQEAINKREPFKVEYRIHHADGQVRWMWEQGCGIFDDDEVIAIEGFITDVTVRKRAEQELQEADRKKDEFLAMLGHELRNPITAIRSAAKLVGSTGKDAAELERVQGVLERQSLQMERLIEGLLDVSRIAQGKIRFEKKPVDLIQLVRGLLEDRATQLSKRHLEVSLGAGETHVWVDADAVRISQAIENLLMNAVKFTDRSDTISLEVSSTGEEARVAVRDTGKGIAQDFLPEIFELFRQAPKESAQESEGLGMGLALVKGLVELHGGRVEARSEGRGKGAEFVVYLPLGEAPSEEGRQPVTTSDEPHQILLVEDDPDIAEVLTLLLDRVGHKAIITRSVAEGLAAIERQRPDMVICDLGLPETTGYELAKQVRADDALSDLPLVALTGFGGASVRRRALESGFDEFLTKPVSIDQLGELCARLCRG